MNAHPCAGLNLAAVSRLPGVSDLPLKVRGPFAQALIAEAEGDKAKAETKLEQACAFERAERNG